MNKLCAILFGAVVSMSAFSRESIDLNALVFENPPEWVSRRDLERIVSQVERALEWDIRKIQVRYVDLAEDFAKTHSMGASVQAFTKTGSGQVVLGPLVNSKNWKSVLKHELSHVVLVQKYRGAVPEWMIEGLSNRIGGNARVNYEWLAKQNWVSLRSLKHPFSEGEESRLHYHLSQAAVEYVESRCPLFELLQLSVGRSVDRYLKTFCRIETLDSELKAWISSRVTTQPVSNSP